MNAGEIARELHEERDVLMEAIKRPIGKGSKEIMLRRIRQIERQLDLPGENYNNGNF